MFGSTELIVIGLIIFILFGAAAIPKFAKSLGQARKEFNDGMKASQNNKETIEEKKTDNSTS
ncbi:twin-arginine translocase TatA/TatE family subunit [Candidatus Marinamargulisbacteria bacterium SCGC AG-439-L15]|nr:twin-arginine translocase TatA/TatE family subunit [Candidatus Marinamargulisbacteria bacterium SCGC AG-439-L15]